ncbi:MAG: putative rane protein [Herbinix sp.]|jgi:hypothetical protein|nr:putative rane protein [Herbinix sp.]
MGLLNKLERKIGRYAIPNLMKYVVVLFAVGLIMGTINPLIYGTYFSLDFSMIMKGQVWRLFTFIIPNESIHNLLFVALRAYMYFLIGNSLERAWGAFRFNVYIFSGLFFTILGSLAVYLINPMFILETDLEYIYLSMFFAFAVLYPETQFLIFFIVPVKVKYLAWLSGAFYIYSVINNIFNGFAKQNPVYFVITVPIIVSMLNFLIFFLATRNYRRISPKEFQRRARYHRQMQEAKNQGNVSQHNGRNVITRHKCAVCGRTELDGDQLEFRFCSKCEGNYEYCMDHLFTHEHVKK